MSNEAGAERADPSNGTPIAAGGKLNQLSKRLHVLGGGPAGSCAA